MTHIASSFLLAALAVPVAVYSTESAASYPSQSPSFGFDQPTTAPIAALPSAAVHSKMLSGLRLEMNTPGPSPASSAVPSDVEVVSPTTAPSTARRTVSDAGVRCEAVDDSTSYRTVELPFYFELETSWKSGVADTLQSVEQTLLRTIADELLACNSYGEDIRRSLNRDAQPKVVAAYVVSDDTNVNEHACPSNMIARSCHLVEIKLAVVVGGDDDEDGGDDAIMSEVYDMVGRAFLVDDEGGNRVKYVGSDPLDLASENKLISQRADLIESSNLSHLIFVLFACGIAATCTAMVCTCSLLRHARGTKKQGADGGDDEEAARDPMSFNTTSSANYDAELGKTNQDDKAMDWPALVYLESLRLSWSDRKTVTEEYGL